MKPPSLTLGIEEEYQIIDPKTRELKSYITELLSGDHLVLTQVKPELHQSIVEVGTKVCKTPAEARAELVRLRREVRPRRFWLRAAVPASPRLARIPSPPGSTSRSRRSSATSAYARTWGSWRSAC